MEKVNDADQDGVFTDEETIVGALSGNVTFRAVITNPGSVDMVIGEVTDTWGPNQIQVCPHLVGTTLAAGSSVTCDFIIEDYAPLVGLTQLNTVAVTGWEGANPDNAAEVQDDSRVNFVRIAGTTPSPPSSPSRPAVGSAGSSSSDTLPRTGPRSIERLGPLGALLVLTGLLVLAGERRLATPGQRTSTGLAAPSPPPPPRGGQGRWRSSPPPPPAPGPGRIR
ncbi:MAG: hypothetical protein M3N51_04455 [Actinomycetota bacterium]|nr:hypothetical protein [Actinomycetota bacterium]